MKETTEIIAYQSPDGEVQVEVTLDRETVWLSLNQMSLLFDRDKSVISRHLSNLFKENELEKTSVVAKFATTAGDGKSYQVEYYSLDVIISVGYRVKSRQGTNFRIWATKVLRNHLLERTRRSDNSSEERYLQLLKVIEMATRSTDSGSLSSAEAGGILKILQEYAYALEMLDKYDHQKLEITAEDGTNSVPLEYEEAISLIAEWREFQQAGRLFGHEKDASFKSSLETIFQTFDGKDLYPSTEEKAANLLYFIVKNHSFTDGNKRIAAGLFVYFLDKNRKLYRNDGSKRIGDNALVAMTIMIAAGKPEEKDIITKLVVNLIDDHN